MAPMRGEVLDTQNRRKGELPSGGLRLFQIIFSLALILHYDRMNKSDINDFNVGESIFVTPVFC